jgi:hypothetical protein
MPCMLMPLVRALRLAVKSPVGRELYEGLPHTKECFGNRTDETGQFGYVGRSRKPAEPPKLTRSSQRRAARAADNGATVHQLTAIFGWRTEKAAQAAKTARTIVRKRLGAIASTSVLLGACGGELPWRRTYYQLAYETARIQRRLA